MTTIPISPGPTEAKEPAPQASLPIDEQSLLVRKIAFALGTVAFVPLFAAIRSFPNVLPIYRSLIGTGVFCALAVAALWFLGREKQLALRAWRLFFVLWATLLLPLLLTVASGLAAEGWPSGKLNRPIARLVILGLALAVPAFLTGVGALVRAYRSTSVLAVVTGLLYLFNGALLIQATSPAKGLRLQFKSVLDVLVFGCQIGSYLSVPIGVVLMVGGIMTLRRARSGFR